MAKIIIESISLTYADRNQSYKALENINLTINEGEFVCILGSSGCGKSTLLSILQGLIKADEGEGRVLIDDVPIKGPDVDRSFVFQHYSLFPWLTAKGNIVFGMKHSRNKYSKIEMDEISDGYLEKVGLKDAAGKYPAQLSGGMQQRIAIARALAMDTEIILMDEPFGAIDPKHRSEIQQLVSKLCREEGKTVVFVTHDIDEALLLADRIVYMEPKRIKEVIPVSIPQPRQREQLFKNENYLSLRKHIMSLFLKNVGEQIGGEEVYL
ncbi:MAG: ABC transporter ATP-binding protein [Clostridiales bacterium]|nr:ABC transporter ATP-binding protein [Clostridiales bacterium]